MFTTGVGNTLGSKIAPTMKITANPQTASQMTSAIDVEVAGIILGTESLASAGARISAQFIDALEGSLTASEVLAEEEIAISRIESTI
jgi:altronate dehydratase large subunit